MWRVLYTLSLLRASAKFRTATVIFVISVRLSPWSNRLPLEFFFYEISHLRIFRKSVETIQVPLKSDKTLHEDRYTFLIIYHSVLLRTRNVVDKFVNEIKTRILCAINFFSPRKSCRLWDNVEKYCTAGQPTDDNIAHAHCILKATNTHTEYVIFVAFPRKQWLYESASMLRLSVYWFSFFFFT